MALASTHVLELPELLELIIIQLPIRGIFQVQRVSTTWRKLISDSPAIQKKLFLKPTAPPAFATQAENVDDYPAYKRCLTVNSCFIFADGWKSPSNRPESTIREVRAWAEFEVEGLMDAGGERPIRLRIDRNRSWHSMFVTQPPCTSARVETSARLNVRYQTLRSEGGLRFKDLVDAMEQMPVYAEDADRITKGHAGVYLTMDAGEAETAKQESGEGAAKLVEG